MNDENEIIREWLGSGSINLFGIPFAGKDTQGALLAEMFDGELIAGGDILRHASNQEKMREIIDAGGLAPTDTYLEIVLPFLAQEKFNGKPLILSSVGRMDGEQAVILKATKETSHPTKTVIMLNLNEEEVWNRFEAAKELNDRGDRADDSADALKNRLEEFRKNTAPVIEFYRNQGLLKDIDGSMTREQVTDAIIEHLYELANS